MNSVAAATLAFCVVAVVCRPGGQLVPCRVVGQSRHTAPVGVHGVDLEITVAGRDEDDPAAVARVAWIVIAARAAAEVSQVRPISVDRVDVDIGVARPVERDRADQPGKGG